METFQLGIVNRLNLEIEQWEDQENQYVEKEKMAEWIRIGIDLYEKLINITPTDTFSSYRLSDLYVLQGTDLKLHGGNDKYKEAKRVLKKALKYRKDDALIYYRLGFLSLYEEQWLQSIEYFEQFLKYYDKCRDSEVTEERYYKAKYKIIEACSKYSEIIVKELDIKYKSTEDPKIVSLLESLPVVTFEEEENYFPFIAFDNEKGRINLTWDDYILINDISSNEVVFDLTDPQSPTFRTVLEEKIIGPQLSKLLILLMLNTRTVPAFEIMDTLKLKNVPVYIKRLRDRLKSCFSNNIKEVICEGYQFNWTGNYRIIFDCRFLDIYGEFIDE